MTRAKKALAFLISILIFLVALEAGLNLVAPVYYFFHSQRPADAKRIILTLGESTSSDIATGNRRSWPTQLNEMLKDSGISGTGVVNFSEPGITTTTLFRKTGEYLQRNPPPQLVISMMGTNDAPHFWYRKYHLIKDEDEHFQFKTLKLFRVLMDYQKFLNIEPQQPNNPVRRSSLDYGDPRQLVADINKAAPNSEEFRNQIQKIETYLATKTNTEKSQFYSLIGFMIKKPKDDDPPQEYIKPYEFYKRSVVADANVFRSLETALMYAKRSGQQNECKLLLENALAQKAYISEVSFGRIANCLPNESDFINKAFAKANLSYLQVSDAQVPTEGNYKAFYNLLIGRNVCWIAMSYPNEAFSNALNQLTVKNENPTKFFTLENKSLFETEIQKSSFDDLFMDRFAENFGHLTEKGAKLLAQNVYNQIQYLKSRGLCGL